MNRKSFLRKTLLAPLVGFLAPDIKTHPIVENIEIGDTVEIVTYGHIIWQLRGEELEGRDLSPELVGQKGIVTAKTNVQGRWQYSLRGPNKVAWYDHEQLKKV